MILNVHCGEAVHVLKSGTRRFRPRGELFIVTDEGQRVGAAERSAQKHAKPNPITRYSGGSLSARLFVGPT